MKELDDMLKTLYQSKTIDETLRNADVMRKKIIDLEKQGIEISPKYRAEISMYIFATGL